MQKAELHMMNGQQRVEYRSTHFEAGSVGLRETNVEAGSWKRDFHFLTWIKYVPPFGHRSTDIARKCPLVDRRCLK